MGVYIIDCVCNLPVYQEAYATLTLALEHDCKNGEARLNIIEKCVQEATNRLKIGLELIGKKQCCVAREYMICKFILRYLALLCHAAVLKTASFSDFILHLLQLTPNDNPNPQSILLSLVIMETMPYMIHILPLDDLSSLFTTISNRLTHYKSGYKPTKGIYAILLSQEIQHDDDDEEEEDDDDEEEEEEPCSGILQDLIRNLKTLLQDTE